MKHITMPKDAALPRPARKLRLADKGAATETVDLSLRLLERLASSREAIGVSELAREFASSKATIYRHLQALVMHGFVHQEPTTMRYAAGIKLFILGERLRERFDILPVARDDLARLRDETGQPATLTALVEDQVVVLEVLQGRAIVNFGTQAGTVLDLHASAHGKVALAFGPEGLLQRCIARRLKAWTPQTICSPTALERAVAQVRSRGWATAPNQVLHGVNGLAAPVFNHAGSYVGAVAIAGSIQYIPASPPQDQIKAVAQTADRISRKLGWIAR
jgi:IclR family transcriptional regulator, acetate operon repressor